jgi:hypothetical protein
MADSNGGTWRLGTTDWNAAGFPGRPTRRGGTHEVITEASAYPPYPLIDSVNFENPGGS